MTGRFHAWLDGDHRLIGYRRFYLVVTALGLLFVIQGVVFGELIAANRARDHRIQASRVYSCRQTYSKMRQILLASIAGRKLNDERAARFAHLVELVDPDQCGRQTAQRR